MLPINEIQNGAQTSNHLAVDPISKIDQAAQFPILAAVIGVGRISGAIFGSFYAIGESVHQGSLATRKFEHAGKSFLRGTLELDPLLGGLYSAMFNSRKAEKYAIGLIQADDYNQANLLLNKYGLVATPGNILRGLYSNRDYRHIFLCSIIFDTQNIDGIFLEWVMQEFLKELDSLTTQEKDDYKPIFEEIKNKKYRSGNNTNIMLLAREIIRILEVDVGA